MKYNRDHTNIVNYILTSVQRIIQWIKSIFLKKCTSAIGQPYGKKRKLDSPFTKNKLKMSKNSKCKMQKDNICRRQYRIKPERSCLGVVISFSVQQQNTTHKRNH